MMMMTWTLFYSSLITLKATFCNYLVDITFWITRS